MRARFAHLATLGFLQPHSKVPKFVPQQWHRLFVLLNEYYSRDGAEIALAERLHGKKQGK